jgi:putative endonuclease
MSDASAQSWWLYLLACKDGRTYAGIAIDVQERFQAHLSGKASKFTRANPPLAVLGAQMFVNRSEASKAEYALKQLDKHEKLAWAHEHPLLQGNTVLA